MKMEQRSPAPTEAELRRELAAVYRLVAHYRMTDLVFTHISVRLPGNDHHFLINPYGLLFEEITASSLVRVDLNGNVIGETPYCVNPAGFVIHSAIHAAREDAACVLHTHTLAGCAVAASPTSCCAACSMMRGSGMTNSPSCEAAIWISHALFR